VTHLTPFRAWQLGALDVQPEQAFTRSLMSHDYAEAHEGNAMTALIDGKPVACAGIADFEGVLVAWAVLGVDAKPAMLAATRACDAVLGKAGRDVFTMVREGFAEGERWIRLLGFERTDDEAKRMPDGRDYLTWVRRHG